MNFLIKIIKKIWNDPVWSKIIAGVIIAVITFIWVYMKGLWFAINEFTLLFCMVLIKNISVPFWLLILISTLCISATFIILITIYGIYNKKNTVRNRKDYTTDTFFGLKWFWMYNYLDDITDLYSCCPKCLYQVNTDYDHYNDIVYAKCDRCGNVINIPLERNQNVKDRVVLSIQREIRSGNLDVIN